MPNFIHKELAEGRWFAFPLVVQMANIGSEVGRARQAEGDDKVRFEGAVDRALDLFDLTLADPRWRGRRFEIARARELFCAAATKSEEYHTTLADMERYFLPFAMAAALSR
jgi:hypothetical protein